MAKEANPREVDKLPIKHVKIGNEIKRVRYDAENKIVYRLNDDDTWDGSFVKRDLDGFSEAGQENTDAEPCQEETKEAPSCDAAVTQEQQVSSDQEAAHHEEATPDKAMQTDIHETESAPIDPIHEDMQDDHSQEEPLEEAEQKKKSPLKAALFPILCIVLFSMIGISLWGSVKNKLPQETEPATLPPENIAVTENVTEAPATEVSSTEASNAAQTQPVEETAAYIQVVASNITLIPGQELMAETIEYVSIPEEEYRQLSAATGIYTAEDLESFDGLVAQTYIPAGRYLTYDDLARSYSPVNPWDPDLRGATTIMLPIVPTAEILESLNWGNRIDLTITVQTKQTNSNEPNTEETAPDGLEHESSVVESMVVDTYKLQSVKIAGLLNADQQSLFPRYTALAAIPNALQLDYLTAAYANASALQADIPAYIVIVITPEQAGVIGALDTGAMTVSISNPGAENTTSLQQETYQEIQEVLSSIAYVWKQKPEGGTAE